MVEACKSNVEGELKMPRAEMRSAGALVFSEIESGIIRSMHSFLTSTLIELSRFAIVKTFKASTSTVAQEVYLMHLYSFGHHSEPTPHS